MCELDLYLMLTFCDVTHIFIDIAIVCVLECVFFVSNYRLRLMLVIDITEWEQLIPNFR
jgi:hypothetical protein